MTVTRRTTLAFVAAIFATPVFAAKPSIYVGENGFAINGYDPVGYFSMSKPIKGSHTHQSDYLGAKFLFSSAQNKATFDADPSGFAPQYGGYCAYAVSKGATATTEPDAWTIENGKLYLNFNTGVREIWRADMTGNIERADANWPKVLE